MRLALPLLWVVKSARELVLGARAQVGFDGRVNLRATLQKNPWSLFRVSRPEPSAEPPHGFARSAGVFPSPHTWQAIQQAGVHLVGSLWSADCSWSGARTILSRPPILRRLRRSMRLSNSCIAAITNSIIIIIIAGMRLLWYANQGMFGGFFCNWKNWSRICVGFHLGWE